MNISIDGLAAELMQRAEARRVIAAIAGPPGSGKSTVADVLVEKLNAQAAGIAAVLPMDGYHFDDGLLNAWGKRARKGAPDTFDVGGLRHMLQRLRHNAEAEIAVPVFDRSIEISRGSARMIPQDVKIIVAEGNYLLLRQAPWDGLRPLFDVTVLLDVSEAELARRLQERWEGYQLTPEQIRAKLEDNDLPNGRFVMAESQGADHRLSN